MDKANERQKYFDACVGKVVRVVLSLIIGVLACAMISFITSCKSAHTQVSHHISDTLSIMSNKASIDSVHSSSLSTISLSSISFFEDSTVVEETFFSPPDSSGMQYILSTKVTTRKTSAVQQDSACSTSSQSVCAIDKVESLSLVQASSLDSGSSCTDTQGKFIYLFYKLLPYLITLVVVFILNFVLFHKKN